MPFVARHLHALHPPLAITYESCMKGQKGTSTAHAQAVTNSASASHPATNLPALAQGAGVAIALEVIRTNTWAIKTNSQVINNGLLSPETTMTHSSHLQIVPTHPPLPCSPPRSNLPENYIQTTDKGITTLKTLSLGSTNLSAYNGLVPTTLMDVPGRCRPLHPLPFPGWLEPLSPVFTCFP
jgi:hypothetical protein